jgi:type I restriction enzyme S subunit
MTINRYILSSEFCESVRDGTHDTPKRTNSGYRLVTSKHIKNGQINSDEGYFISEEDFNKINERSLVEQWDVLMSMIGTIGEAAIVKDQPKYAIKNVALFKCGDELKAKWLYYFLCSPEGKGQLFSNQKGASQQFISLTQLRNLQIPIRDQSTMKKITDILSAYDDLIENNQKQIKLLEEAAMRLYKEWFVKLRFPGYENTKIVDGVPEGWELTTVKEMGQVITGKTPSTAIAENYGKDIPFVKIPDMHGVIYPLKTEVKLSERGANTQKNKFLPPKSIMVSCIATVGLVCITHEVCQTNQQINSIVLNDEDHLYYMFFKMKGIKSLLEGVGSNGATMTNVNKTKFENIELLKPENEILKKFNNLVEPFFSNILALSKQNEKLKEARDKLLSKLMSGEIEV